MVQRVKKCTNFKIVKNIESFNLDTRTESDEGCASENGKESMKCTNFKDVMRCMSVTIERR